MLGKRNLPPFLGLAVSAMDETAPSVLTVWSWWGPSQGVTGPVGPNVGRVKNPTFYAGRVDFYVSLTAIASPFDVHCQESPHAQQPAACWA